MGPSLDCCECFVAMKRPKPFLRQRGSPNPNKHQTNTHTATAASQPQAKVTTQQPQKPQTHTYTYTHTHQPKQPRPHTHIQKFSSPQHRPDPSQPQKTKTKAAHTHNSHTHTGAAAHIPSIGQTRHTSTPATFPQQKLKFLPSAANHTVLLEQITHLNVQTKISFQIYRTRSSSQLCSATFQLHCLPGYRLSVLDWNCAGRRDVLHVSMQHAAC